MFERNLIIGGRHLAIRLSTDFYLSHNNHYLFGFPIGPSCRDLGRQPMSQYMDTVKGYFLYIGIEDNSLTIANDITGGYRLYIYESENTICFSDDPEHIIALLRQHERPQLDRSEFYYWRRHGYTTGEATYLKNLRKLAPATVLEFSSNGSTRRCYMPDIENTPDTGRHSRTGLEDIRETLETISSMDEDAVLFFSGGVDSTLLALYLKELKKNTRLVFAISRPGYSDNHISHMNARTVAGYLGLPLDEIEIDMNRSLSDMADIARRMPFDRHLSVLHFGALAEIKNRYGRDIIIINGQGADSVLSFGPTTSGKGDFAARALMYHPFGLISKLAGEMVKRVHGRRFRLPASDREYLNAFIDQFQYYTVLSDDTPNDYIDYRAALVERLSPPWKHREALMMYLKMYTFLQGSDNQVVLTSARSAGINRVVMPYVSPGFITSTIRFKDKKRDLYSPKYVIKEGLKSFGIRLPHTRTGSGGTDLIPLEQMARQADKAFMAEAELIVGGMAAEMASHST